MYSMMSDTKWEPGQSGDCEAAGGKSGSKTGRIIIIDLGNKAIECFVIDLTGPKKPIINAMKMRLFLIIFALISLTAKGQFQVQTAYQVSHVWRSGIVEFGYGIKNHIISIGYQLNKDCRPTDEDGSVFKRRFFGRTLMESSSLSLGYEYKFNLPNRSWRPSLFATTIVSHAPTLTYFKRMVSTETGGDELVEFITVGPPLTAIETYIGCGFDLDLTDNFYLYQKWGVGYSQFIGIPMGNTGEFGTKFQIGLGYVFNKRA